VSAKDGAGRFCCDDPAKRCDLCQLLNGDAAINDES
jgi:hypothetical protein